MIVQQKKRMGRFASPVYSGLAGVVLGAVAVTAVNFDRLDIMTRTPKLVSEFRVETYNSERLSDGIVKLPGTYVCEIDANEDGKNDLMVSQRGFVGLPGYIELSQRYR